MRDSADPVVVDRAPSPVRLRFVVLLGALALLTSQLYPRMQAAFRLHTVATAFADYALCMVGPLGPALLRDNPSEFRKLARRRLVLAGADERPFFKCAKGAGEIMSAVEVERAHRAEAASFLEWGGAASPGAVSYRLDELSVTTKPLAALAESAWPFVRSGYLALIQPSAYAAEAPHPTELPRPGVGRGPTPARSLVQCTPSGESSGDYVLSVSADRRTKMVRSVTPEGVTSDATLAPVEARVFAVACDDRALVAAVGHASSRAVSLYVCPRLGSCTELPLPRFGKNGPPPSYPLDVARVDGVTVVLVPMNGLVRVASTRDDGRAWTPFVVAFDASAHPELRFDTPIPSKLFTSEKRLVLYGEPQRRNAAYPILVSDDAGASFHAP
jgi:hypothetical protein